MRFVVLALGSLACGHQDAPAAPAATVTLTAAPPSPTQSISAPPVATATASATPTASATDVTAKVRCSKGQLNTPCLVRRAGSDCIERGSNCTALPCTESAPWGVDCALYDAARDATACDVVDKCMGVSDEGCAVGPHCNPFRTCLDPSSVAPILAAGSCDEVRKRTRYVK